RLRALRPRSRLLRWHGAWLALVLAMPLGIALLALAGYFIAASYFFGRMSFTIALVLGAAGLYGLMALWVHLQRARLTIAERQEQALQAQQSPDVEDAELQAVQPPRIDIAALGEQTRSLLNLFITLLLLTGIWLIWRDAVPMLSVVSDYTLWRYEGSNIDGKQVSLPLTVGQLFLALLVAAVTALVMRNIGALLDIVLLQRLEMQADATYAIKVAAGYLIVAAGVVTAANILGIRWTDVHWLVAALGVGLGFGLQEIFANFISGLIVLAERPIRIGDVVTVGDVTGVVSRIRARATAVVDFENKEVIIPNKSFITEKVVNWTLSNQITRLLIPVGVAYGSDIDAVQRLMLAAVRAADAVLTEPAPTAYFVGFGDSALNFEIRAFVDAFDKRLRVQHAINLGIERAMSQHSIQIPFPQRELHIRPAPGVHCDVQSAQPA
ncbi:MAG: mechanosensitive ion channel domain-containing protein, partial [Burkholderiales bacterium]